MWVTVKSLLFFRQGPLKPEVLSIQWSGRRSNRRLQRNSSLSPNNPLLSLINSGGLRSNAERHSTTSSSAVRLLLLYVWGYFGASWVMLPWSCQQGKIGSMGVSVWPLARAERRRGGRSCRVRAEDENYARMCACVDPKPVNELAL